MSVKQIHYNLPEKGKKWTEIEEYLKTISQKDLDWRRGRHAAYVWHINHEVEEVAAKAYTMFLATNGLNTMVFPSLARMEAELVASMLAKYNCPEANGGGAGQVTSGGTESVFLGVYAAREWAKKYKPNIKKPKIIAAYSAHPAVNKAAYYLGLEVVRVPVREDFRVDVQKMAEAVDENTIMLYASAPAYSVGVVDPIAEIAALAKQKNLYLHVDACVGGILGPFVRDIGYPVPIFDFSLDGVCSISADLHKSGFTAKGASLLLFINREMQSFSTYEFHEWSSGAYHTDTITGTRPGGAIAAAWAVMHYLGQEGYKKIAKDVMELRNYFVTELTKSGDFHIIGEPDLWAVCFGSKTINIKAIMLYMLAEGFVLSPVEKPEGIHLMLTPVHAPYINELLDALNRSVEKFKKGEMPPSLDTILLQYS